MEQGIASVAGWVVGTRDAWIFLAAWVVVVLSYASWRSRGEAPQDPIRPSGPTD